MYSSHLKARSLRLLCLAAFIIVEDTPFSLSIAPNFFAYGALTQANTKMLKKNRDGKLVTDKNTRGLRHLRATHNIFLDELVDHLGEEDVALHLTKSMKSKKSYGESGVDSDEVPTSGSKRSKAIPSSQKTGKERKRGNKKRGKKKKGKQPDKKSEFWDIRILCYILNHAPLTTPPNSFTNRCLW